jgi:putative membrane protein
VSTPDPVERPAKRLSPLTPLVRGSILVVAVLASNWDDALHGNLGPIALLLLALLAAGALYGVVSWLRTRYWIEADELRVDTGVVVRQSRRIRVDRLQGIDIAQPFVARLFGLAELRMDVAGSGNEGSLAFLPLAEAQDLRRVLLARRDAVRAHRTAPAGDDGVDGVDAAAVTEGEPGPDLGPPVPERVVARLDLGTLLVSLLLSGETVLFVLVAGLFVAGFLAFGEVVGGIAVMVPVVVGFALTQVRKLSAYYGFTVSSSDSTQASALHVSRGLFELDTQTVALARVQGLVVTEPFLWRALGWARLGVSLAGSHRGDSEHGPATSTVMPVAPRAEVLALARLLLAEYGSPDPDEVRLTAPPARARWVAPVRRLFLLGGVGEHLVVSREGMLTRRTHVVPHARVQSLRLHQGPWQRRLGLADLLVDSPPGPVSVRARHRDAGEARRLLDREQALAKPARGRLRGLTG